MRRGIFDGEAVLAFLSFSIKLFKLLFPLTLPLPQFVIAHVQRHPPQVGGEFTRGFVLLPLVEKFGERFLTNVFSTLVVIHHANTKAADRALPAIDQQRKGRVIIFLLHAHHGFLIAERKDGGQVRDDFGHRDLEE